jgi:hypothetical protein
MEEINELIKRYGLEESHEYVIIPFVSSDGRGKRCFLLKRRFIRIMFEDGHYVDSPLAEAIEAIRKYPELKLSEALYLIHKEEAERAAETGPAEQDSGSNQSVTLQ